MNRSQQSYSPLPMAAIFPSVLVLAHGGLTIPPARNNFGNVNPLNTTQPDPHHYHSGGPCSGDECLWFSEGCWIGCESCSLTMPVDPKCPDCWSGNFYGPPNCAKYTPLDPTLPEEHRTWNIGNPSQRGDWTRAHPWRAPGRAPTADPCGIAGGYAKPTGGGGETPTGARQGDRGSRLAPLAGVTTEWAARAEVEVGWMVGANHGMPPEQNHPRARPRARTHACAALASPCVECGAPSRERARTAPRLSP